MSNVYLSAAVNPDRSLTIPAFAVRRLGYLPGDEAHLALPVEICARACDDSELLISRVCDDYSDKGYTTAGAEINIPLKLMTEAAIPAGSEISALSSAKMPVIAAVNDGLQRDLTDEPGCFMAELGYDPESVETAQAALLS